jgi:hypothetical protein
LYWPASTEGISAAWLYDLLKPHVTKLGVCDPRKNKSTREGNQSDKIDARRLAELLRLQALSDNPKKLWASEYQIELWLTPNNHVPLCWFRNRLASLQRSDEKPLVEKTKPLGYNAQQPRLCSGRPKQLSLHRLGREASKIPAVAEVFFLDFPFYRTYQALQIAFPRA